MAARLESLTHHINRTRCVQRLQEMVRIPAVAGEERPMAEYVARALQDAGCTVVRVDPHGNVLGEMGGGSGKAVLFLTHTDAAPAGTMAQPYSGEVRDGAPFGKPGPVVYGRGACAPKAAIAAMLEAVAALREAGIALRGRLLVAAVTKDLRANHEGIRELAQSTPLRADYVVAGEPSDNQIVLGARGIGHFEVRLEGRPAHWGRPAEAVNPLYGLADLLRALETLPLPSHPALGPATVSPFEVRSEATPPRTPHLASLMLDRRLLPEESVEAVGQALQRLVDAVTAARPGLSGRVTRVRGMYPYNVTPDSPTVQLLQAAARAVVGRPLPTTYITFSSNAGYTIRELGIDGVAFGPGRIVDVTDTEHVEVDRVCDAALIYAAAAALAAG